MSAPLPAPWVSGLVKIGKASVVRVEVLSKRERKEGPVGVICTTHCEEAEEAEESGVRQSASCTVSDESDELAEKSRRPVNDADAD